MLFDPVLSHERFSLSHRGNNIKAMRKGSLQAKGRWVVSIYIYIKRKKGKEKRIDSCRERKWIILCDQYAVLCLERRYTGLRVPYIPPPASKA